MIAALLTQARRAGEAAMPAYTHLQRAEPVLVAHWLLAYCEMFFRDIDRLADCAARFNYCPLGSGAIAGATLRLDRELMARELDFSAPTANSLDATSDRDFCLEFTQALSIVAIHLSRMAEEFILFSTQEYGFITLPESYSTGSSAMPQKQNPDSLELIRGKSGRVISCAQSLLICLKGLPLAYNKDMQETQEPVFIAVRETTRHAASGGRIHPRGPIEHRAHERRGRNRVHECHGGGNLPGGQRHSISPRPRVGGAGSSQGAGKALRTPANSAR